MKRLRASGILLHPTSLPGEFGIGDLGKHAFAFVDLLARTKQTYWQILPLGPTGYGDSPYQCFSAFAGNTLLISPEHLVEDGFLTIDQIADRPQFPSQRVDYGAVHEWKNRILPIAFAGLNHIARGDLQGKFENFVRGNEAWLDDYALYRAIKGSQGQKAWYEWDETLRLRDQRASSGSIRQIVFRNSRRKVLSVFVFPSVACRQGICEPSWDPHGRRRAYLCCSGLSGCVV